MDQRVLVGIESDEDRSLSSVLVDVSAVAVSVISGNVRCVDSVELRFYDESGRCGNSAGAEQQLCVGEPWQYGYGKTVIVTSILVYSQIGCCTHSDSSA